MAEALEANKTLEEISVGNVIVGSTVKLKSSGELKVLTSFAGDGDVEYDSVDGECVEGGWVEPSLSEFDAIPAVLPLKKLRDNTITDLDLKSSNLDVDRGMMLAAMLKSNNSVTKVSDDMFGWCDKQLRCCCFNLIHNVHASSMTSCSAYCLSVDVFDALMILT